MLELQRIKRLIIPFIKGLPFIIVSLVLALFIAKKIIQYSVPKYQSIAKVKLDDNKYGHSANNLYEDFDLFSTENKIETEAEVLKSSILLEQAIKELNLNVSISRIGSIKKAQLYKNTPFTFSYTPNTFNQYDRTYIIQVNSDTAFEIFDETQKQVLAKGFFGQPIFLNNSEITIDLNSPVLAKKSLDIIGSYEFEIRSVQKWIKTINEELDVKAIHKEIPIIRVVMETENPQFSADFANKLCEIYMQDYVATKSMTATKTLEFVEKRMAEIKIILNESEDNLEFYKQENKVINTLQETETGIRGLSKLKLQAVQLEMDEKSIIDLEAYISKGNYYDETAILFGFGDLTLTELVKKLKLYSDEKKDLLLKYTESNQKVVNTQQKIDDVKTYIKEAIVQNKKTIQAKRIKIQNRIAVMSKQFDGIPTREKELRELQRDFQINESVYTFLAQKKLEAQIASTALISFHRIIQHATVAQKPVSPNKTLITFILGLLGLFLGLGIVYSKKCIKGTIQDKTDIEKITATPVIGIVKETLSENESNNDFTTLATAIKLKSSNVKQTILITSSIKNEGKTYITKNLHKAYLNMGYSVAIIDCNPYHHEYRWDHNLEELLHGNQLVKKTSISVGISTEASKTTQLLAHKNTESVIKNIQNLYDIVLIDSPGSIISINAFTLLKYTDQSLYVVCSNQSKVQYISNIENIKDDYQYENMSIVLNRASILSSYSGNFYGSQLNYTKSPTGFIAKLKHYYKFYS